MSSPGTALPTKQRRRVIARGLLRALTETILLFVVYFALPLNKLSKAPMGLVIIGGLVLLGMMTVYQLRATMKSRYPAVRAIEALAMTVPLFLLLFSATYYVLSQNNSGNFNAAGLSRSDTLYFTVTVFATVGFGDIVATSQTARMLVTVQMVIDLIVIGLLARVFVSAVQMAREAQAIEARQRAGEPDPG